MASTGEPTSAGSGAAAEVHAEAAAAAHGGGAPVERASVAGEAATAGAPAETASVASTEAARAAAAAAVAAEVAGAAPAALALDASVPLVLVTGVTGYIGAWVARYILAAGFRVRAAVRSLADDRRYRSFAFWAGPTGHKIDFVEAGLESPSSWPAAVAGCTYVVHVASPVPTSTVRDEDAEVIRPAVQGTRNVIAAALACPTVRRIVMTSSVAAVFEGREREWDTHTFGEADW